MKETSVAKLINSIDFTNNLKQRRVAFLNNIFESKSSENVNCQ